MTNQEITLLYQKVRHRTEELCQPLCPEDYIPQPVVDVSPPRWHIGHTTWFFETFILKKFKPDYSDHHPAFNYLFNSYYHSVGERWERDRRGHLSRPTVREVYEYRKHVDEQLVHLLENIDDDTFKQMKPVLLLGINHEQQHQELLLTDLKYILCLNPMRPVYNSRILNITANSTEVPKEYVFIPEGNYSIGYCNEGFCFDNETPNFTAYLPEFKIRKCLISNKEYLEFMNDGGYSDFRWWLSEGWEFIQQQRIKSPMYWELLDGQWHEMTLSGFQPVELTAPVTHISYYEAEAFAAWAGKRMPTEAEWEAAANYLKPDNNNSNFQESNRFHPAPFAAAPQDKIYQMLGDVWEWTASAYLPYPGYKPAEGALGEYNGKFMINQMVLKGGSCVTPKSHIRTSYRNFFHPDKRWQFSGVRLVEDVK